MNENVLIANLLTVLHAGFASRSITVGIKQNYQPTQQGAPSAPTVFLHKINDNQYGYPGRKDAWNTGLAVMQHTENQWIETTFQVNATAIQDPANTTQLTSGDYVKTAARILGSDAAVTSLAALGIGILRIQKIRNTQFVDEKAQNEASPSFDFTVSYQDVETTSEPSTAILTGTIAVI